MEIAAKFNPAEVENKWYQTWIENNYFSSRPDHRKPYTIVISPPSVTDVLHLYTHARLFSVRLLKIQ